MGVCARHRRALSGRGARAAAARARGLPQQRRDASPRAHFGRDPLARAVRAGRAGVRQVSPRRPRPCRRPRLQLGHGTRRRALCVAWRANARSGGARDHRWRPSQPGHRGIDRLRHGLPRVRESRGQPRDRRRLRAQVLVLCADDGALAVAHHPRVRQPNAAQRGAHRRGDRGASPLARRGGC